MWRRLRRRFPPALPGFPLHRKRVLRVCQAHGWSLAQWQALSEDERLEWLAWDEYQQERLRRFRDSLHPRPKREHEDDGMEYPLTVDRLLMLFVAGLDYDEW